MMDFNEDEFRYFVPDEKKIVRVDLSNGERVKCIVLFFFSYEDNNFCALQPVNGSFRNDIYPFLYSEFEDETFELSNIDDDDLYDFACELTDFIYNNITNPLMQQDK